MTDGPRIKRQRLEGDSAANGHKASSQPWSTHSWRTFPIKQQPTYPDQEKLAAVVQGLATKPPLVHQGEVMNLRRHLAEAAEGKRFILQGGACAETFHECQSGHIENNLKIMLQMSLILVHQGRMPVTRIMRMGGQYAKPRSKDTETINGRTVPSYRGDIVNSFDIDDRTPNPSRLETAYTCSAATLNYIRALNSGGFASLRAASTWSFDAVPDLTKRSRYQEAVKKVTDSLSFMDTIMGAENPSINQVEFFTSHEGLLLEYESALTRTVDDGKCFNLGAHYLWIGDRTRQLDHAHIEYFRGIENPIGVKVGPTMENDELVRVVQILNPDNIAGKVTLITRYGAKKIRDLLPGHIKAIKNAGLKVVWQSDPMHGNTEATSTGIKTRRFENILAELQLAVTVHKECSSTLNGVHFELTGEKDVTECIGGAVQLEATDLGRNYQSQCDPRLNCEQSLEIAFRLAETLS